MRRLKASLQDIASVDNLWSAWLQFRRGKRTRPTVARFEPNAARHVLRLHRALIAGSYRPQGYRLKVIRDPKVRLISAAPVRDRIVHHALHRQLAEGFDRNLIDHTYACLPGRGSHRAVLAFQRALRKHPFVLALDIRRYFLSIDRDILANLLARRLRDPHLIALIQRLLDSGAGLYEPPEVRAALDLEPGFPGPNCGLPIGNLTSQWWANLYLSGLDHFLKRELRVPHVQRYMDDLHLFAPDRAQLTAARDATATWLDHHRALQLEDPEARPRSSRGSFDYLGYRVSRGRIRVAPDRVARAERRLRHFVDNGHHERAVRALASYAGWIAYPGQPPSNGDNPQPDFRSTRSH